MRKGFGIVSPWAARCGLHRDVFFAQRMSFSFFILDADKVIRRFYHSIFSERISTLFLVVLWCG
jgi:hypothetical protein